MPFHIHTADQISTQLAPYMLQKLNDDQLTVDIIHIGWQWRPTDFLYMLYNDNDMEVKPLHNALKRLITQYQIGIPKAKQIEYQTQMNDFIQYCQHQFVQLNNYDFQHDTTQNQSRLATFDHDLAAFKTKHLLKIIHNSHDPLHNLVMQCRIASQYLINLIQTP